MFADSFYDSPRAQRSRRGWTTLASFTVQALAVGLSLVLPLIYTGAVPQWQRTEVISLPQAHLEPPPGAQAVRRSTTQLSNLVGTTLIAPPSIPNHIAPVKENEPAPQVDLDSVRWGTDGRTAGGNSAIGQVLRGFSILAIPPPPAPVVHSVRVSRMAEGMLIHRVQPEYPPLAKAAGIQGAVVLQAVIGRDGGIEKLRVVSGHPFLVQVAVKAVEQWRYKPYCLNGEAVEVETQVTVNFVLAGRGF